MSAGYSFEEIKQALIADCDGLALRLLGEPEKRQRMKPWRWNGSDKLELTRTGKWRGFFRDWRAGRTYNPIGAAALVLGLSYEDAARWAAVDYLRWPDRSKDQETPADRQRRDQAAAAALDERKKREAEEAAAEAKEQAEKIDAARRLWGRGVPIKGTPAETYLKGRAINADTWPDTLRWHPSKRWLMVLSTSPEGDATALQAIHLTDDGKPVTRENGSKIKLTHGVLREGAVRFAGKGDGPVVICEGPETALAVWYATGFEAWAGLGSISGVSVETIPHDRTIVACPDDDARGAPTIQAANKAVRRWKGEGRTVLIATPYETLKRDKSDHNDALRQHGPAYVAERFRQVLEAAAEGDPGASLDKAQKDLGAAISQAVSQLVDETIRQQLTGEGADSSSQIGIRVSVGGGKTKEAIASMVGAIGHMREALGDVVPSVVYAVPTHRLGAELIRRIEAEAAAQGINVSVRIWRGREAIEPESGEQMCLNIKAVKAAEKAMLKPQTEVCQSKRGECPFFSTCKYQAQRKASANVWLVPHASLFHERPQAIGRPSLLIVDESIWQSSLRGFGAQKTVVGLATLKRAPKVVLTEGVAGVTADPFNSAELHRMRQLLLTALQNSEKGPLKISTLLDVGVTAELCRKAGALEWKRLAGGGLRPGMDAMTFINRAETLAKEQGDISRLAVMWKLLAEAIDSGNSTSGRLSFEVVNDGAGSEHEALVMRWAVPMAAGWNAPTLHVDATLRPDLLKHLFPRLRLAADIKVETPHQRTVAVVGKAFSHRALTEEADVLKMWRAVLLRARLTAGETLVVVPKRAEDIIRAKEAIPAHVHLLHHNGTAGLDSFGQVNRLIVVGRTLPPPAMVSAMTAAITGEVVAELGTADGWYKVEMATVRARDGSAVTLPRERHLPGIPEEIRASVCADQLIQAMGRGRGVRRTADTPLEVEVWGDCEPPVEVDAFHLFEAPSKDEQAMAAGLWVEAAKDVASLHPSLGSENAIKTARKRLGSNSNKDTYWNMTPTSREAGDGEEMTALAQHFLRSGPHLRLAAYRKAGPGMRPGVAIWDARVYPDPKAALVAAVGELAVWQELRWPAAIPDAPPEPQKALQEPVEELVEPDPPAHPNTPAEPLQPVSGGILTSPLLVSVASHATVSRRFRPPPELIGSVSSNILNAGLKSRRPTPWPTWVRP